MKALILPGCGSRGIIQAGAIQAYLDKNYTYDALYCTSAGSLNGVLLHQGDFDKLKHIWQNMRNDIIFKWNPLKAFGSAAALTDTGPLKRLINQNINVPALLANPKPIFLTATQISPLMAITKQLHDGMDINAWVLASASVPVMFPIQIIEEKQYCDGGVIRDFNILQAALAGEWSQIDVLYPGTGAEQPVKNIIGAVETVIASLGTTQFDDETTALKILNKSSTVCAVNIYRCSGPLDLGLLDFNKAGKNYEKYFKLGYDMLSAPAIQYRKVLNTVAKPQWNIYRNT